MCPVPQALPGTQTERGPGSGSVLSDLTPHPLSILSRPHLSTSPLSLLPIPSAPPSTQFPGLESRARRSTCATSLTAARLSERRPCCGLMCACTLASGPLSATGSSVGRGSHGVTSSSGTPAPTQVCSLPCGALQPPAPPHSALQLPASLPTPTPLSSATWRLLAWPRNYGTEWGYRLSPRGAGLPGKSRKPFLIAVFPKVRSVASHSLDGFCPKLHVCLTVSGTSCRHCTTHSTVNCVILTRLHGDGAATVPILLRHGAGAGSHSQRLVELVQPRPSGSQVHALRHYPTLPFLLLFTE